MIEENIQNTRTISLEEINFGEILSILLNKKFFILALVLLSTSMSILYSFNLANIYTSSVLLAPADDNSKSSMLGQMSGLAGLAGVSLADGSGDKSTEAIERVQTYEFFSNHFLPNILLEDLMAVSHWDPNKNSVIYDEDMFKSSEKKWIRKSYIPFIQISKTPSTQEAFNRYKNLLTIEQNKKTSFVKISINHESAHIAKEWTRLIVSSINKSMRDENRDKTTKSLEFLNNQYSQTNYKEIKQSIASLQEEQMKSLMLIEASKFYVFKVLDYPIAPEKKSSPKRSIFILFGIIAGLIIASFISIIQFYGFNKIKIINPNP
jgi:LPS O-antigen subunit length determinant protein (WzzB/FepE family)|tara:strand:+ start:340 stop:1302 length:963 start_codon:yes stop_codon:yes gene_type:complete